MKTKKKKKPKKRTKKKLKKEEEKKKPVKVLAGWLADAPVKKSSREAKNSGDFLAQ